ncbi:hypothetical protein GCM10023329_52830 [Streptomyces sanyensis]|uniref:Uncharacterized protein n=1 Tax=Streptomyces sanyensis TaxID=568869 RepID=A0ABP9BD42_9ACTN
MGIPSDIWTPSTAGRRQGPSPGASGAATGPEAGEGTGRVALAVVSAASPNAAVAAAAPKRLLRRDLRPLPARIRW